MRSKKYECQLREHYIRSVGGEEGEQFLNITIINLLIRFNKTREILLTQCYQVLSILQIVSITSASVECAHSKERVT